MRVSNGACVIVVAGDAEGKLVHVGLAEDQCPGFFQFRDHRCGPVDHVIFQAWRCSSRRHTGNVDAVLDGDGNAMQRPQKPTIRLVLIGLARCAADIFRGKLGEGIQVNEPFRSFNQRLDIFSARHSAAAKHLNCFNNCQPPKIHVGFTPSIGTFVSWRVCSPCHLLCSKIIRLAYPVRRQLQSRL